MANSMYGGTGLKPSGGDLRGSSSGSMREKIPSGYSKGSLQKFTPEAMNLYNQLFSNLGSDSQTSRLARGDEGMFEQMEKPAWRDFERGMGAMGNRYAQLAPGAMSAQRGSGFSNRMNQANVDFAERLQANRQSLSSQALRDLFSMSNTIFGNQPYENFLQEKKEKKALGGWGGVAGGILGGAGGFMVGGPAGAMAGASIGSSAFSGM